MPVAAERRFAGTPWLGRVGNFLGLAGRTENAESGTEIGTQTGGLMASFMALRF